MAKCAYKRHVSTRVCSGDLHHYITLQSRALQPAPIGGVVSTGFTTVKSVWAFSETTRGTRRFKGVNVEDNATHLFYIRYDADFFPLDGDNFFILFDSRRFRILRVTEADENKLYMVVQCCETGQSSQAGSGGS